MTTLIGRRNRSRARDVVRSALKSPRARSKTNRHRRKIARSRLFSKKLNSKRGHNELKVLRALDYDLAGWIIAGNGSESANMSNLFRANGGRVVYATPDLQVALTVDDQDGRWKLTPAGLNHVVRGNNVPASYEDLWAYNVFGSIEDLIRDYKDHQSQVILLKLQHIFILIVHIYRERSEANWRHQSIPTDPHVSLAERLFEILELLIPFVRPDILDRVTNNTITSEYTYDTNLLQLLLDQAARQRTMLQDLMNAYAQQAYIATTKNPAESLPQFWNRFMNVSVEERWEMGFNALWHITHPAGDAEEAAAAEEEAAAVEEEEEMEEDIELSIREMEDSFKMLTIPLLSDRPAVGDSQTIHDMRQRLISLRLKNDGSEASEQAIVNLRKRIVDKREEDRKSADEELLKVPERVKYFSPVDLLLPIQFLSQDQFNQMAKVLPTRLSDSQLEWLTDFRHVPDFIVDLRCTLADIDIAIDDMKKVFRVSDDRRKRFLMDDKGLRDRLQGFQFMVPWERVFLFDERDASKYNYKTKTYRLALFDNHEIAPLAETIRTAFRSVTNKRLGWGDYTNAENILRAPGRVERLTLVASVIRIYLRTWDIYTMAVRNFELWTKYVHTEESVFIPGFVHDWVKLIETASPEQEDDLREDDQYMREAFAARQFEVRRRKFQEKENKDKKVLKEYADIIAREPDPVAKQSLCDKANVILDRRDQDKANEFAYLQSHPAEFIEEFGLTEYLKVAPKRNFRFRLDDEFNLQVPKDNSPLRIITITEAPLLMESERTFRTPPPPVPSQFISDDELVRGCIVALDASHLAPDWLPTQGAESGDPGSVHVPHLSEEGREELEQILQNVNLIQEAIKDKLHEWVYLDSIWVGRNSAIVAGDCLQIFIAVRDLVNPGVAEVTDHHCTAQSAERSENPGDFDFYDRQSAIRYEGGDAHAIKFKIKELEEGKKTGKEQKMSVAAATVRQCQACGRQLRGKTYPCQQCKMVSYCDKKCMKKDKTHKKKVCARLANAAAKR